MDWNLIISKTVTDASVLWAAVSAVVTFFMFGFAIYTFKSSEKQRRKIELDVINEKIKNATFILLDIEQMDRQRQTLQTMIDSNECNLHFYGSIMSGCGLNIWPQNKIILLNKGLDRYQVEKLDSFYSIACEIDDHLKRCKTDFYRVMRAEMTFVLGSNEIEDESQPVTKITTLQRYLNGEHTRADTCVTPIEIVHFLQSELKRLPDLSALKSVLNTIIVSK